MLFLRQTLLSVCLILLCAYSYAQPIAGDNVVSGVPEDSPQILIDVLLDDEPGSGFALDPTSIVFIGPAVGGTFTLETGQVAFTPDLNFNGPASVQYQVSDTEPQQSNIATIIVNVEPINDAPIITSISDQTIDEDGQTGVLSFTISDPDNPPAS